MNTNALKQHLKYIVPEMKLALIREPGKPVPIVCPEDIARFVEPLKYNDTEHFVAFHLDALNHVIGYHVVSQGSVSMALVHPREVFKAALLANSVSLIVAHNHPAGSLVPSREDFETTETLIAVGNLLQILVVDHIIVTTNGLYSLRENHPHLWKK